MAVMTEKTAGGGGAGGLGRGRALGLSFSVSGIFFAGVGDGGNHG